MGYFVPTRKTGIVAEKSFPVEKIFRIEDLAEGESWYFEDPGKKENKNF